MSGRFATFVACGTALAVLVIGSLIAIALGRSQPPPPVSATK